MRKRFLCLSGIILFTGLLAAGCNRHGDSAPSDPLEEATGKMGTFQSEDELESYLLDQFAGGLLPEDLYGGTSDEDNATDADSSSDHDTPTGAGSSGGTGEESSFSGTNLQEAGVDESDKVKTDGTHFYIARDQTVSIAATTTNDITVGTVDLVEGLSAGDTVYVSGTVAVDSGGKIVGVGDIQGQTRCVIEAIRDILGALRGGSSANTSDHSSTSAARSAGRNDLTVIESTATHRSTLCEEERQNSRWPRFAETRSVSRRGPNRGRA